MVKILVCGGRDYCNWGLLSASLTEILADYYLQGDAPPTIIHGGAKGADWLAKAYAIHMGWPEIEFPADWQAFGKGAGGIRNQKMLDEGRPDLVVAFQGGRGTADMIRRARKSAVEVHMILPALPQENE